MGIRERSGIRILRRGIPHPVPVFSTPPADVSSFTGECSGLKIPFALSGKLGEMEKTLSATEIRSFYGTAQKFLSSTSRTRRVKPLTFAPRLLQKIVHLGLIQVPLATGFPELTDEAIDLIETPRFWRLEHSDLRPGRFSVKRAFTSGVRDPEKMIIQGTVKFNGGNHQAFTNLYMMELENKRCAAKDMLKELAFSDSTRVSGLQKYIDGSSSIRNEKNRIFLAGLLRGKDIPGGKFGYDTRITLANADGSRHAFLDPNYLGYFMGKYGEGLEFYQDGAPEGKNTPIYIFDEGSIVGLVMPQRFDMTVDPLLIFQRSYESFDYRKLADGASA
jgi:hypothetical protein